MKERIVNSLKRLFTKPSSFGKEITSGPWPFYREVLFFLVTGSIFQLFNSNSPTTLREGFPSWYVYPYLSLLSIGGILVLISIQWMKPSLGALAVERSGTILVGGCIAIYLANFIWVKKGPPETAQTLMMFALISFSVQRLLQIRKEKREIEKALRVKGMM